MLFKKNTVFEAAWIVLAVCFVGLGAATFFVSRPLFYAVIGCTAVVILLCVIRIAGIRKAFAALFTGFRSGSVRQSVLSTMSSPVVITDSNGSVLWYNSAFKNSVLKSEDIYLENISRTIDGFNVADSMSDEGCGYLINDRHFTVCSNCVRQGDGVIFISFLHEDTTVYRDAVDFKESRPSVLLFMLDSYDELSSRMSEGARAEVLSEVFRAMEDFINQTNGIFARLSDNSYIAIVEERHMRKVIEKRFAILDTVRAIPAGGVPVSMSIGVGRGAKTLYENHMQARRALDMALGRGGDQAAMKTKTGYEFFGGVSKAVEKRNKVKSRIMANALEELVAGASRVMVMGHKNSDLDALGAAVGMLRFSQMCGKEAHIIIDQRTTMAGPLLDKLKSAGRSDWFLTPTGCLDEIDDGTLLIVVDCHTKGLMECADALKYTKNVVIIDHHRKMVDYISNPVLSYLETYASSCCELVTELLQSIETGENRLTPLEAQGVLSGIMLDTKDFTVRTGVRTFEAASYLRSLGAETTDAKLLFSTDLETYRCRAQLVSSAEVYRGCAVAITDSLPDNMRVVMPQAADELLLIEGISASIVAVKFNDRVNISARSYGSYNVQLIMEKLGGGGHQTMAGVQLGDLGLNEVRDMIFAAVDSYLENNEKSKQ